MSSCEQIQFPPYRKDENTSIYETNLKNYLKILVLEKRELIVLMMVYKVGGIHTIHGKRNCSSH